MNVLKWITIPIEYGLKSKTGTLAMIELIEKKKSGLIQLCRKHRVKKLELFGSAALGEFQKGKSDLDFLVEFLPLEEGQYANAYFGLMEDLESIFNCPVELVMPTTIKNPYFIAGIQNSRITLYAA